MHAARYVYSESTRIGLGFTKAHKHQDSTKGRQTALQRVNQNWSGVYPLPKWPLWRATIWDYQPSTSISPSHRQCTKKRVIQFTNLMFVMVAPLCWYQSGRL